MGLPHKISTLLYCFNERDQVLLMRRAQEPNVGLWSPPGGKLLESAGESPHACACREAAEEVCVEVGLDEARLTGIVTETGHDGNAHWLMFLFEITTKLQALPPPHREGKFEFFSRHQLDSLKMPKTDREMIWPLFWRHRGGFF